IHPSSCSQRACTRVPSSARWRTPVRNGRSSSSAISAGTCPVSASTEVRPVSTSSNGPSRRNSAASARAVASGSEPANAGSVTSTASMSTSRARPHATASRSVSSADGGPSVKTVTRVPSFVRASSTACDTARRQYGFISSSMPSRRRRPSGPSSISSNLGTCFTSTAMRTARGYSATDRLGAMTRVNTRGRRRCSSRSSPSSMSDMATREAVIVDCARSAFGKRKGALAEWHPTDLLGLVLRTIVQRNDFDPALVDDVVGGCVTQAGEQGCNVTRNAWVAGGLPWTVPATSVDRQCGSSQQAVHFVAQGVMAGAYDCAIAGGVEAMTRAPMSSNARGGGGPCSPEFLAQTNNTLGIQFWVAQVLADKWGIARAEMDEYALQSHQRAAVNTDNGFFGGEIVPVGDLVADEGIRRDASLEKMAALPPAW